MIHRMTGYMNQFGGLRFQFLRRVSAVLSGPWAPAERPAKALSFRFSKNAFRRIGLTKAYPNPNNLPIIRKYKKMVSSDQSSGL